MGLNFRKAVHMELENDPSWSYSGFGIFREKVARSIGIDLNKMEGYGGLEEWDDPYEATGDPIIHLLNHSDCDGILTSWQCNEVYPRLEEILKTWEFTVNEHADLGYDFRMGKKLVEAMKECAEEGADLIFC